MRVQCVCFSLFLKKNNVFGFYIVTLVRFFHCQKKLFLRGFRCVFAEKKTMFLGSHTWRLCIFLIRKKNCFQGDFVRFLRKKNNVFGFPNVTFVHFLPSKKKSFSRCFRSVFAVKKTMFLWSKTWRFCICLIRKKNRFQDDFVRFLRKKNMFLGF